MIAGAKDVHLSALPPVGPRTLEETGLVTGFLVELTCKILYAGGTMPLSSLSERLALPVSIASDLAEILKKRGRDESDFQLRIVVHPSVLERLRTEDEKLLIEMEKRYFGKLSFRADSTCHAEQFKIINAVTNEELVSVGG